MSTFATRFAGAPLSELYALYGQSATYTAPAGGGDTDCTVIRHIDSGDLEEGGEFGLVRRRGQIKVRSSELATAALHGRFTVGSDGWQVVAPPLLEAGQWRCEVEMVDRDSQAERRQG